MCKLNWNSCNILLQQLDLIRKLALLNRWCSECSWHQMRAHQFTPAGFPQPRECRRLLSAKIKNNWIYEFLLPFYPYRCVNRGLVDSIVCGPSESLSTCDTWQWCESGIDSLRRRLHSWIENVLLCSERNYFSVSSSLFSCLFCVIIGQGATVRDRTYALIKKWRNQSHLPLVSQCLPVYSYI